MSTMESTVSKKSSTKEPQIFAEQVADARKLTPEELEALKAGRRISGGTTYTNVATSTGWWPFDDSDSDGQVDSAY